MKNTKLVATLGAVALVAAVGLGSTLAYLSDTAGPVTNTFTFGNVSFDKLKGGLRESEVARDEDETADTYGQYIDVDNKTNEDGNTVEEWTITDTQGYTDLYPGETVFKDPTVFLADDSNDAWVYAKVVYDKDQYTINYSSNWVVIDDLSTDDYDFVAKTDAVMEGGDHSTIFSSVTVSDAEDILDEDLSDIVISAAAVQALGFADSAAAEEVADGLLNPQD
ncbi:MAG: hypothetical protein K6A05_03905 [Lachnospiraceae bacterium]|nr:hypothetical protein [Lachnospiraceae bacterium]